MKKIKVFAPATVANLGCGFDVLGMAVGGAGDVLEIGMERGDGLVINNLSGVGLPEDIEQNVVTPAIRALLAAAGGGCRVEVDILQKILPGSGIGSSAASAVAAVYGLNELLGRPFGAHELIEFAMEGELLTGGARHADNVAPALLGGIVLVRGYEPLDFVQLPVPRDFHCTVVHPHIAVMTKEGRRVLPGRVPLGDAVRQWGNVGGLVAGLSAGDMALVGRSVCDAVAEPCRKAFIPGYDRLKAELLAADALAVNIAGSGPSVFAISDSEGKAQRAGQVMSRHFAALAIPADVYRSFGECRGAYAMQDEKHYLENSLKTNNHEIYKH